ncbi:MAG: hemin uptake protein HemP [Planctomycetaceae bacterium]|nr:hemin uptake protein HemP [Planctomycetaceae bacterium]
MNNSNEDVSALKKETYEPKEVDGSPPVVSFSQLAQGAKEVVVEYEDQHYRLRVTRNGKLILNK